MQLLFYSVVETSSRNVNHINGSYMKCMVYTAHQIANMKERFNSGALASESLEISVVHDVVEEVPRSSHLKWFICCNWPFAVSGAVISGRHTDFTFSLFHVDLYSKENHKALKNAIPSSSRTGLKRPHNQSLWSTKSKIHWIHV